MVRLIRLVVTDIFPVLIRGYYNPPGSSIPPGMLREVWRCVIIAVRNLPKDQKRQILAKVSLNSSNRQLPFNADTDSCRRRSTTTTTVADADSSSYYYATWPVPQLLANSD